MWICPKCGRTFKNNNQQHYCGEKPTTIEEYISQQNEDAQPELKLIQEAIASVLPDATQKISWSMPTFWKGKNLIHFAASKKHIGIYPGDKAVEAFLADLDGTYRYSKGSIQVPYGKVDLELIKRIALWCSENY